jgi:hypothetical protein
MLIVMYQQPFSVSSSSDDIHIPASILVVSSVMTPRNYVIQKTLRTDVQRKTNITNGSRVNTEEVNSLDVEICIS